MRPFAFVAVCSLVVLAGASSATADDYSSDSYTVSTPAITPGGYASSASYTLQSLIGGLSLGTSTSATFGNNAGFLLYPFVSTPVVAATAGSASVALSWTSSSGYLGWDPSGYSVGQASVSGGPYTFTGVGDVLSSTQSGLTNGTTYYFVVRVLDAFGVAIATSSQASATPASSDGGSGSGGGGGGGSGTPTPAVSGATVNLSGRAYPGSVVTVLKDAQIVTSAPADSRARFNTSITGLSGGHYLFLVYGLDSSHNRSTSLSFPITVAANATVNVTGIFLAPTISVDKSQVKQGDNIAIFGESTPDSTITINVNSESNLFVTAASDASGAYLYNLDTSPLELDNHLAKAKAAVSGEISSFGASVGFTVGAENVQRPKNQNTSVGDLNADGRINLVDFSVMAYWYTRPLVGTGTSADLNHDGTVDLVDFSILVSHWTG